MKRYKETKGIQLPLRGGGGGSARVVGEVVMGLLSSGVLSFFRGRRGKGVEKRVASTVTVA